MDKVNQKKLRPPFPLYKRFPTRFERATYKVYNAFENRLWPMPPSLFSLSLVGSAAYHYKMELLPKFENKYLEFAKLGLVSFSSVYVPIWIVRQFLSRFYFTYKGFLFEQPKKPSITTKIWGALRSLLSLTPPLLKSCDKLLPSPSCPDLDDTVRRYLASVKNLLDEEEFKLVSEQAETFLREEGRKLHTYARMYSLFADNYVTPFWEKYAYLYSKAPVLINSSVAHVDLYKDKPATWPVRAAHVLYIEALSQLAIDRQQFKPLGDGLLCARHYEKMYAVTRVPDAQCDYLKNYGISKHVVLYYKGSFYKIQVCDEKNNMYSVDQLTKIFAELVSREGLDADNAEKQSVKTKHVAALTCDTRDKWAANREKFFLNNPVNKKTLEEIESAIFFLIYDDTDEYEYNPDKPEVLSNYMRNMLTGNGANRWSDKSLNYIVAKNTRCGGTTEHSIADGSEFDHIMENFVYMDTQILKYPSLEEQKKIEKISEEEKKQLIFAKQLEIEVSDEMASEIERCMLSHTQAADDVDISSLIFRDFGKGLIKKFGVSPDGFIQMAIQVAQIYDQGKFVLTYEPASARFYKFSRTETLRTVSDESCDFVRSFMNAEITKEEKIEKLKKACVTHGIRNRECMVGKGVDRHLFVLYILSKGTGISSAFLDYYISQKWLLSTSHVPNVTNQVDEDALLEDTWLGASFAAVAKNGYGVCYRFGGNHSIIAHISSFHSADNTSSKRFTENFTKTLKEMAALFE
ncbi:unnamed protein product [Auanema sp. JU1783]|nr:unnamed protein product [Auanema sp. JU1783]